MKNDQSTAAHPSSDPHHTHKAARTYSLTVTLAACFGTLTFIAVLSVLFIALSSAGRNTIELTREKATLAVDNVVQRVEAHLAPARAQLNYLGRRMAAGELRTNDPAFTRDLSASLAAAPQIAGVAFITRTGQLLGVERGGQKIHVWREDLSGQPPAMAALGAASQRRNAFWGSPVLRQSSLTTVLNLRLPIHRNGTYQGMLVAVVTIGQLSGYLQRIAASSGGTPFILYDGDYVLAHPGLTSDYPGRTAKAPLPSIEDYADAILLAIANPRQRRAMAIRLAPPYGNFAVEIGDEDYLVFYRDVANFGPKSWRIGLHVTQVSVGSQVRRLIMAAVAGLIAMVLSVLAAIWLGRRVARPVIRIAAAAELIAAFRLDDVPALRGSRIRELNAQARAFNTMLGGLRWFEAYVPKRLVERLMSRGDAGALPSKERDLTIMFTDIAGYTSLSEGRDAAEVAALLNDHFALIAACIEAEDGTVDKFIGDSVMAFWGAPDKQKNRAIRACRAALAIREAITKDNKARIAAGAPPIRMRIGLHSGLVTVGNIGAPGRLNYTIVGDAVNVASRIEGQGRQYAVEDEAVTILISGETKMDLDDTFDPVRVGEASVRGRTAPVELYRLA
ncbi:MAG TPA: adenylate/guanylate cyclase domain-containing protein [Alphaproteobacteria bacterium]|nr:adenylate/guanylate cyclase domain-containing protein [Alphaproteobacteria bacterium]